MTNYPLLSTIQIIVTGITKSVNLRGGQVATYARGQIKGENTINIKAAK